MIGQNCRNACKKVISQREAWMAEGGKDWDGDGLTDEVSERSPPESTLLGQLPAHSTVKTCGVSAAMAGAGRR